jgi:hypothetical protein
MFMKKIAIRNGSVTRSNGGGDVDKRIRIRAYELFEQRGREQGHEMDDWLLAEKEIHGTVSRNHPKTS